MDLPLNSNEQSKVLIFLLLMLPSVFLIVGIIPAIFLYFGVFMMKKHQDFSHVSTAVRNFRIYVSIILIGSLFIALFATIYSGTIEFFVTLSVSLSCIFYLVVVGVLFFEPLYKHREWVEINGIFSIQTKNSSKEKEPNNFGSINETNLAQHSVADELAKWVKLKESGHVTEEEFNDVRKKLLSRT